MIGSKSTPLNYIRRLLATGFCFSVFGIGGLVLGLIVLPLVRLWPGDNHQRNSRARRVVHYAFRYFVGLMDVLGCNHVELTGGEQLRNSRGQLVIANHPSLIDVVILIGCIPSCNCIVKQALWRHPFMGGVLRLSGYMSNSDPEALLAQCRQSFDAGSSIVVFPEGTRTVDNKPLKFQRGAANIAVRCAVDILPVTILADPPTLKKGMPWYHIPSRRSIFYVDVKEPLDISTIISREDEPSVATRRLNRYLQAYYQGLLEHA